MPKAKKKSNVWSIFEKNSSTECRCKLCGKVLKSGGGTTNLKNHLLHKHPSASNEQKGTEKVAIPNSPLVTQNEDNLNREEVSVAGSGTSGCSTPSVYRISTISFDFTPNNQKQLAINQMFYDQKSYEVGGTKEAKITQALLYMMCVDVYPLNMTEKKGLKHLLKTTAPLYKVPSRRTMTRLMENKYSSLKELVIEKLKEIEVFSITTDIATVMNASRSFIVLTLHFIDERSCAMSTMYLGVKILTKHHTALNICSDLQELLDEWSIEKKRILAATTDQGANIVAGIKALLCRDNQLQVHVPCFAHIISLVVLKAIGFIPELVKIIEQVIRIVSYFKHSNVVMDDLREEQEKEGKSQGTFLYLIQEVSTRWNSTFYCLERFILLSPHVGKILLLLAHTAAPRMVTATELEIIKNVLVVLSPFESATKDISGEKYVSSSLIIPLTNCINTSLNRVAPTSEITIALQNELKKLIVSRLNCLEKNMLISVATILDPRFKKLHFSSPLLVSQAIEIIRNEVRDELKQQGALSPPILIEEPSTSTGNSIWNIHDEVAAKHQPETFTGNGLPAELKLYLNQPILPRHKSPIEYWLNSKNAFPGTSKIALRYLTVLGASVSSERVVSILDNICSDERSRLTPGHTNELVFLCTLDDKYWSV